MEEEPASGDEMTHTAAASSSSKCCEIDLVWLLFVIETAAAQPWMACLFGIRFVDRLIY